MAVFKCKMCGGALEIAEGQTVCECEYCGTRQTLPRLDGERKANLYDRANHFRRNNEFDKAAGIYDQILNEDPTDAEAYWSLVLCRYGVEYVEDPASHKRVPTVNRAQFTSIYADENYKQALARADILQKTVYEAEAADIDEIQRGILAISEKEEPFDVFICYKETDAQGRRTPDSVLATELYHELTKEGFKVFFSRITLEDKLGTAYEPYIFAALNSARVMVVLGTRPEYFNAVWVKNEWNRYLALVKQSGGKKTLIPAYRDMDPYDLPEEFSHLQAQDMSKLGFMPDLIRGIKKLLRRDEPKAAPMVQQVIQSAGGANLTAQIKRGQQALEDRDWSAADRFFDKALDLDAECAEAFFGKALAAAKCSSGEQLIRQRLSIPVTETQPLTACERDEARIERAVRENVVPGYLTENEIRACFAYDERQFLSQTAVWQKRVAEEKNRWENDRLLNRAVQYAKGETAERLAALRKRFDEELNRAIADSRAADERAKADVSNQYAAKMEAGERQARELRRAAEERREGNYQWACQHQREAKTQGQYQDTANLFKSVKLVEYRDSLQRAQSCQAEADRLKEEAKRAAAEKTKQNWIAFEQSRKASKARNKKIAILAAAATVVLIVALLLIVKVVIPANRYSTAEQLLEAGFYEKAIRAFQKLDDYRDSAERVQEAYYTYAESALADGNPYSAIALFKKISNYSDSEARVRAVWDETAIRDTVAAGGTHTVGLRTDGTAVAVGCNEDGQCDVSGWTDLVAVAAGGRHTVGLRSDGTVVAVGDNSYGQCNVGSWQDIVAVAAGAYHTVGLRSDGWIVAVGCNEDGQCSLKDLNWQSYGASVADLKYIVAVAAGWNHTVALLSDGTVRAVGDDYAGQCDVSGWKDITAVAAGGYCTIGLRSDGSAIAVGYDEDGRCDVSGWSTIVAIRAWGYHTFGLRRNGTVISAGYDEYGQCDVYGWTDMVPVSAGTLHTVGLRSDGSVIAVGQNDYGQCDVEYWTDIKLPNR